MHLPEQIILDRLVLVRLGHQHSEALFRDQFQDTDNLKFMTVNPHAQLADTERYIEDSRSRWQANDRKEYAIEWQETGEVIGTLAAYPSAGRVSLGIVISSKWGRLGIASEATRGLVAVLQRMPVVRRIWAYCDASHGRSRATLLRCGFLEEGIVHAWATFPSLGMTPRDCIFFYFPKTPLLPLPKALAELEQHKKATLTGQQA